MLSGIQRIEGKKMENEFTPGPWRVAYLDQNGQSVVQAEHIEVATCWHHCVDSIEKEMHANATLIAAAPDLLAALELADCLLSGANMNRSVVERKVRNAIAKARGQS